jgi:3-deoxy-7-phosphoheptulonate synthase
LSVGLPVGCEFLDPVSPQYIADAVSWGAIGARTSQSQIHRQFASGLSMPIGFKNSTEGDIQGAIDAVRAAARPHVFAGIAEDGRAAIFATTGNPGCHVVLRGGARGANYDEESVARALELLDLARQIPRVVIDASRDNSGKDHLRQTVVAAEIAARLALGAPGIVGVMLESFLVAGRQHLVLGQSTDLVCGQSITDSCIGWEDTIVLLDQLAEAVVARSRHARR